MTSNWKRSLPWLTAFVGLATTTLVFAAGPYRELLAVLGDALPFDERPARDLTEARERLAAMDARALALYASHLRWDLGAMLGNCLFLGGMIVGVGRRWPRLVSGCLLLPILVVLGDAAEDVGLGNWLSGSPTKESVQWVRAATHTKFLAFGLSALALAGLLVLRGALWIRARGL